MNNQTEIKKIIQTWWNKDRHYTGLKDDLAVEETKEGVRVNLYTEYNRYHIVAKDTYLGCTSTCRRAYIGENWTRGRDFPDGKFTYETWSDIIRAIAMHEFIGMAGRIKDTMFDGGVAPESKS